MMESASLTKREWVAICQFPGCECSAKTNRVINGIGRCPKVQILCQLRTLKDNMCNNPDCLGIASNGPDPCGGKRYGVHQIDGIRYCARNILRNDHEPIFCTFKECYCKGLLPAAEARCERDKTEITYFCPDGSNRENNYGNGRA